MSLKIQPASVLLSLARQQGLQGKLRQAVREERRAAPGETSLATLGQALPCLVVLQRPVQCRDDGEVCPFPDVTTTTTSLPATISTTATVGNPAECDGPITNLSDPRRSVNYQLQPGEVGIDDRNLIHSKIHFLKDEFLM